MSMCRRRRVGAVAGVCGVCAGPPPRCEGCSAWAFCLAGCYCRFACRRNDRHGVRPPASARTLHVQYNECAAVNSSAAIMRQSHGHRCLICTYTAVSYVHADGGQTRRRAAKFPRMAHLSKLNACLRPCWDTRLLILSLFNQINAIAVSRNDASKPHIVGSARRRRRLPRLVVDRRRSAGHSWEEAAAAEANAK